MLYFAIAVATTALGTYLFLTLFLCSLTGFAIQRFNTQVFLLTAGAAAVLIIGGSLWKSITLSGGGERIARMFGAGLVESDSNDLSKRQLLNIVEEISIASGVVVPSVYLLHGEPGINAFAAGTSPDNAVIIVTRGCLEKLNRDELQGVIAHEFSHILNGDMKLNVRLIGVLFGLYLVSLIGTSTFDDDFAFHPLRFLGMIGGIAATLLIIVGFTGVYLGRLIKAAISRQREFLADAAAVQFTRNPAGLANALKKVASDSHVRDFHKEETSHLFFADALRDKEASSNKPIKPTLWRAFGELQSSHPPILERIAKLDPTSEVNHSGRVAQPSSRSDDDALYHPDKEQVAVNFQAESLGETQGVRVSPAAISASIGSPTGEHLDFSAQIIASLPSRLVEHAHCPKSATAVVYSLLIHDETEEGQLTLLSPLVHKHELSQTLQLLPVVRGILPNARLPLAEMTVPALRQLPSDQLDKFCDAVQDLIVADEDVTLFEFAIQRIVVESIRFKRPKRPRHRKMRKIEKACDVLFSALASVGRDADDAAHGFESAIEAVTEGKQDRDRKCIPKTQWTFADLDAALTRIAHANAKLRKKVIQGCAACVIHDGLITLEEGELLRAFAISLSCPMPPLVFPTAQPDDANEAKRDSSDIPSMAFRAGDTNLSRSSSRKRKLAVNIIVATVAFVILGGASLFFAGRQYAAAAREVESYGGDWVEESHYSYRSTKFGPYVSANFEDTNCDDAALSRLAARIPYAIWFGKPFKLDLRKTKITDIGVASLQGNRQVCFLDVGETNISDKSVKALATCRNLECLWLPNSDSITDDGMRSLVDLSSLKLLSIGSPNVSDTGIMELKSLKKLRYLRLWHTRVTPAGSCAVKGLES